ncbi:mRNA interferase MazF [Syntrophus gentianae]|uniref:mRNA interferase MazF n=1 Tax=Syntrophus gentianae TaxID=43775 RepID=A0A1H7V406_9BACT|nr:type II toxin-antitoxin system PemK/MazF family toxin [Syntrophus gentianae]SEM03883.1 mRNA interferase MazF [Syntrophus gentianae]
MGYGYDLYPAEERHHPLPQTDQQSGKLRPALVVRKLPSRYEDWLISMVSSQLSQEIPGFDEIVSPDDPDFKDSGLKLTSLIRVGRLAVVNVDLLLGKIGQIGEVRLTRIRQKLSEWILST